MAQRVSLKLLILFGVICTTFIVAESRLYADTISNKSSTFSTQLSSRDDNDGTDSELAEKIRAQRAAIEARENRDTASTQSKAGAKQNNCDSDLRKCISNTCGANYKKCETDTDTTFSDKLTACRKETTCTAHEFTLFTNEIKEDKKQAIELALYNEVLDCGNSYNDCIIQQCGPKFNKCLSKSAGDNAITACKTIAQNCTEADSGLVGRVGNVFGIVRQTAEKQIKADEQKLQKLRDSMRNSCRTLGAMFDDRTLDCVFNVSFYAGDDQNTPKASKKLYAGSMFDCTPDWFGIDITTFKENAYRLTRAQTAASSAMLGSGIGTAVGALTSGAIGRAIDTKKAKDALKEECEKAGKKIKDGKCDDDDDDDEEEDNDNDNTPPKKTDSDNNNQPEESADQIACEESGGQYGTTCICKASNLLTYTSDKKSCTCIDKQTMEFDPEIKRCYFTEAALKACDAFVGVGKKKATGDKLKGCVCPAPYKEWWESQPINSCVKETIEKLGPATNPESAPTLEPIDKNTVARDTCTDSGGDWDDKKKCSCSKNKGLTDSIKGFSCTCNQTGYTYDKASKKCVQKK